MGRSKAIERERFVASLNERCPAVAAALDALLEGWRPLKMATFSRATHAAIDSQGQETLKRHFRFRDEGFRDAAPDVAKAVNASSLEPLRSEGRKAGPAKARGLRPARLHQALIALEEDLAKLHGGSADA
ncbi:MAG: hypothetical protein IRY99_23370 [Isosphaeraceae bacterium]|nr:hypothetical protein [Isosphaeraceae bacterium]